MKPTATVKYQNGQPILNINGEIFPPMAMTTRTLKPDYLRRIREAGIRIFFVFANTDWMRPHREQMTENGLQIEKSGFETFTDEIGRLLEAVPDAYVIVRLGMHPPVDWVDAHPDDILRYNDGNTVPCDMISEIHYDRLPGSYSLCSDAWRTDASAAMLQFCDQVDKSPFSDRVIGYFLAAGGTSEWYYVNQMIDRAAHAPGEPDRVGDFSPAFQKQFERYLREHYADETALQTAWHDPEATFSAPKIPLLAPRTYIDYDDQIFSRMQNLERVSSEPLPDVCPERDNIGVFLNAEKNRAVYDFYEAWHDGTADSVIYFARVLKEHDPGKVTGAFYGSLGCTDFFGMSTSTGTDRILDSGVVDFLAAPGVYNNREPGGSTAQREMHDSFRLRGTCFVVEDDTRTHLENDFYRDSMRLYTPEDSCKVLKREFGRNICQGTYAWWFDQHLEGGRYDSPEILSLFRRQQEIALEAIQYPHPVNEIAVITDLRSVHLVSAYTDSYLLDYYRTSELSRIGAGTDYYHLDDLARPEMPDYKCYLILNGFSMTDTRRAMITEKASRNHAVVIWLYAPGIYDPETGGMNDENIRKTVRMTVRRIDEVGSPRFDIVSDHPIVRYADRTRKYGFLDRPIQSNVWLGSVLRPAFCEPNFYIEEDGEITVLGRFCLNGRPALAVRENGDYTDLYCAAPVLRSELLRSAAEYAGCHIYSTDDDCLYSNGKYLTLHAAFSGCRTLRFPYPCAVYEVYEQRYYTERATELSLEMTLGETKMFRLDRCE